MCFERKGQMHSVAKSPITCYKVMNMYMGKCRRTGRPLNSVHYPSESFYYIGDTITASIDADTYYLDKMNKFGGEVVHSYDLDAILYYDANLSTEQILREVLKSGLRTHYLVGVRCEIPVGEVYWYDKDRGEFASKSLVIKEILDWCKFSYEINLIKTNLTHVLKGWY